MVYDELKKQCFACSVGANNVFLWPDRPFSFKVDADGSDAKHVLSFKTIADQFKFGVQIAIGKSMHWPSLAGPMVADDLLFGSGPAVEKGSTVEVKFIAWVEGPGGRGDIGVNFDGNVAENAPPLRFEVGKNDVLQGLEDGALGMRQGGSRRLIIPPSMGYGEDGVSGLVPPNSVIHLDLTIERLISAADADASEAKAQGGGSPITGDTNGSSDKSAEHTVSPTFHYARICTLFQQSASGWEPVTVPDAYGDKGQLGIVLVSASTPERKILIYDKNKQPVLQCAVTAEPDVCSLCEIGNTFDLHADGKNFRIVLKNAAETAKFATQLALARSAATSSLKQEDMSVIIEDLVLGSGTAAESGDRVFLRYQGWLEGEEGRGTTGILFDDNTSDDVDILEFRIGDGQVVMGLDRGVTGMKPGGKRYLVVPPRFGYGPTGVPGNIPPNSTLYLELDLKQVAPGIGKGNYAGSQAGFSHSSLNNMMRSTTGDDNGDGGSNDDSSSRKYTGQQVGNGLSSGNIPMSHDRHGGSRAMRVHSSDSITSTGNEPVFFHMSTCHVLKVSESGYTPVSLPGYGTENSLGYVVMSPGNGPRKLIVYAPVLQADLSPESNAVNATPMGSGIENCFTIVDEEGKSWLMALKGADQASRLEKQLQDAKDTMTDKISLSQMLDVSGGGQ